MNQEDMQNKIDSILKESKKNNELKQKKERKNKGKSVNAYVSDYCVVDIETTDSIPNGEIIEFGAIKVRNHKIIDTFSTLIKPPCYICKFITELTGITNDMVKDAPVLDDVIDKFLEFVGNDIIVGYNNSSFDMCVLYDYILKLRGVFSQTIMKMCCMWQDEVLKKSHIIVLKRYVTFGALIMRVSIGR